MTELSRQAQNSINLYRGNAISSIKMGLGMQRSSVVNVLKEYFGASSIDELAIKLSNN